MPSWETQNSSRESHTTTWHHQGEGRWMARLSEAKRKHLKQLQRKMDLKPLVEALDNLLPFVSLWPSLQIGTFHRLLNLRCPDELQNYLIHVRCCWDHILDQNESLRPLVDFRTVQLLETLSPRASIRDGNKIEFWMGEKKLFPMVADSIVRNRILYRLKQLDRMIPSLHTFLEDTKWLEPCAKIVRSLLPPGCRDTTRSPIFRMYNGSEVLRVQDSSIVLAEYEGSEVGNVEYGYLQLWLFAWRHFPEISGMMPRKDRGEPKPEAKASNEQCRYQFAQLASSLGFESSTISAFQERDPDINMALDFLREARPEEFFTLPEETRSTIASRICQVLPITGEKNVIPPERPGARGELEIATDHRFGRPHEQSHNYSKWYFFLEHIYADRTQSLSYFTVNRDIFLAFFGLVSPWKPSNEEPEVNLHVNSDDRIEAETTALQDSRYAGGTGIAPIPLAQGRMLDTNSQTSIQPGPITNNSRVDTETITLQQSNPGVNKGGPGLLLENRPVKNNPLALAPATMTQERGAEQYRSQGDESVLQMKAVNVLLGGEGTEADQMIARTVLTPALFEIYGKQCKIGDKFFVKPLPSRWSNVPSGQPTPEELTALFTTCHFAAWSSAREQLVAVGHDQLDRFARSSIPDGVIYVDEKGGRNPDRLRLIITGTSTKERLDQLEDESRY